jgi:hypothetical protein
MTLSVLASPHTAVPLVLVGFAVMSLMGCGHLFQVCGPALVITPTWDSTSVGGSVTFQALAQGGGCGVAKSGTATADALWRVKDTTVARISTITADDLVTVVGVRPGQTPIGTFWQGLTAVAYFQVN